MDRIKIPHRKAFKSAQQTILRYSRSASGLGVLCIVLGVVILVFIFSPTITYHVFHDEDDIPYPSKAFSDMQATSNVIPEDNRLVIPKIDVDISIVEGRNESALWSGAWRYPGSAKPGENGNTVITGHRMQFLPPSQRTFYLLDKMEVGDVIVIYWEKEEYDYRVNNIYEVAEDQMEILEKGDEESLRLFTCTPLIAQDKRLVVEAKPI